MLESHQLRELLSVYPVADPRVAFIRHNENITYQVTDQADGKSYLLRIHKPVTENLQGVQHTPEGLRSEMQLLADIAERTQLIVQTPVRTLSGQTVALWETDGEAVPFTLLNWIDGKTMERPDLSDEDNVRRLGRELGLLHRFFRSYSPPSPLVRPVYGLERNAESLDRIRYGAETGIIRPSDMAIIEESFALIDRRLGQLGKQPDLWGLIHADMNMGNVIVTERGFGFIDFCLSGYGYYMLDAAHCALNVGKENRDAYLESYAQTFPLPDRPLDHLASFVLSAIFGNYAFQMKNPAKRERIRDRLPVICETYCKPFLTGGESLFHLI
ncbi:phosphotransferase enzyme family protein [Paenibacillus sp. MBLB4367]|uniref:phosphotransferase enzyme family protein n=1 Tax=Paenibacillus sp. MBLB4367 TaxID=3384767 RepID=UPI0039081F1A